MQLVADIGGARFEVLLAEAIDLSRPLYFDAGRQPQAFHLPPASARAVEVGSFVGDLARGGSCRCEILTLTPHGNGTHTECSAHIQADGRLIRDALQDVLVAATLATVEPLRVGADRIITVAQVQAMAHDTAFLEAVVLRTMPNPASKVTERYSGQNPPYLAADAAEWLAGRGVRHLLLDLPSADREDDGGHLRAHRAFLGDRAEATITEMIYVPDAVPDGSYVLNLQIAPFMLDAAPSRPVLFPVRPL